MSYIRLTYQRRLLSLVVLTCFVGAFLVPAVAAACEGGGGEEFDFQMGTMPVSKKIVGAGSIAVEIESLSKVSGVIDEIKPGKPSGEWSWSEAAEKACERTYSKKGEKCSWTVTYAGKEKSTLTFLARSTNLEYKGTMVEGEP